CQACVSAISWCHRLACCGPSSGQRTVPCERAAKSRKARRLAQGAEGLEGGVQGRGECRVPDRYRRRVRTPREQGGSQEELRGLPQRPAGAARERLEGQGEACPARGFSP